MSAECPVVWVRLTSRDRSELSVTLRSTGLGESTLAELSTVANGVNRQTDLPQTVSRLLESHRIPGAILLWNLEEDSDGVRPLSVPALALPAPLGFFFEPVPLNDSSADLLALWRADHLPRPEGRPSLSQRLSRVAVVWIVAVIAVILTASALYNMEHLRSWLSALVVAVAVMLCYLITRPLWVEWMVMPGGVVVPRILPGPAITCRNNDTVLSLFSSPPGWTANLWQKGHCVNRKALTEFEALLLLAAWQASPANCSGERDG